MRLRFSSITTASLLLSLPALVAPGCATVTGLVTGAPTGLVDGPAQVYRFNSKQFDEHPEFWVFNILIVAPLGLALGPAAGLVKGIAADVRNLTGQTSVGAVYGEYGDASIWRPWTFHFDQSEDVEDMKPR